MIASRVGDGRFDSSVVYSKAPAPGIWQPPASGMALAWLAFLKPVVDVPTVQLDGPDLLGSPAYAADYNEVKRIGSATRGAGRPLGGGDDDLEVHQRHPQHRWS